MRKIVLFSFLLLLWLVQSIFIVYAVVCGLESRVLWFGLFSFFITVAIVEFLMRDKQS